MQGYFKDFDAFFTFYFKSCNGINATELKGTTR